MQFWRRSLGLRGRRLLWAHLLAHAGLVRPMLLYHAYKTVAYLNDGGKQLRTKVEAGRLFEIKTLLHGMCLVLVVPRPRAAWCSYLSSFSRAMALCEIRQASFQSH